MGFNEIDIVEKKQEEFRSNAALKVWNIATALGLILPFFIFVYARITNRDAAEEEYGDDDHNDNQANGDDDQEESESPWWWSWKAELEQEAQTHVVMTFLYVWTFLLVIVLAILVNRNFNLGRLKSVRWFLLGFLNYALICSAMIGGIPQLIKDGGEELQDIGWYGQMSVLTFLSCVSEMISSLVLTCWIGRLIQIQQYELEKEEKGEHPYAFF